MKNKIISRSRSRYGSQYKAGKVFGLTVLMLCLIIFLACSIISIFPGTVRASATVTSTPTNGPTSGPTPDCGCNPPPPPPPTPPITGNCSASPASPLVGGTVTWKVNDLAGGDRDDVFRYSWGGTGGLSGSGQTVTTTYSTPGTKNASVSISTDDQTVTFYCSVVVVAPIPPVSGSCYASPSSAVTGTPITWKAQPTGGNGTYTYLWGGDDNLTSASASSVSHTYSNAGTYNAHVAITSNGQTFNAFCSVAITAVVVPPSALVVSCAASPVTAVAGTPIAWTANASGGIGNYHYSWSGDDGLGLSGTASSSTSNVNVGGATVYHTYQNAGTYNANVSVTSGAQSAANSCSVVITAVPVTPPPPPPSTQTYGGGGLEVPDVAIAGQTAVSGVVSAPFASDYISLTQVPYTGLADYPPSFYFMIGLAIWAFAVVSIYYWMRARLG